MVERGFYVVGFIIAAACLVYAYQIGWRFVLAAAVLYVIGIAVIVVVCIFAWRSRLAPLLRSGTEAASIEKPPEAR